jgi:hypothetical protein
MDTDELGWHVESYYPMGWLERPFGRKPYPDMTYGEAIDTAIVLLWNMYVESVPGADVTRDKLVEIDRQFITENPDFPGRSMARVHDFSNLWRGPVVSLLTWFTTKQEG